MNNNFGFTEDQALVSELLLFTYKNMLRTKSLSSDTFALDIRKMFSEDDITLLKRLSVPQFNDASMLTILKCDIDHKQFCEITIGLLEYVYHDDPTWPYLSISSECGHKSVPSTMSN
jgi:hypothetical protein